MISVIIPAYNVERYIGECLESVLSQTYGDIEVIVVDDGSTDETADVAGEMARRDSRLRVLRQNNLHAGVARNNGMNASRGDYLLFFDADDRMYPTMLEKMLARAEAAEAQVVICCSRSFQDQTDEDVEPRIAPKYVDLGSVYSADQIGDNIFYFAVGWPWDKLLKADFIYSANLQFQDLSSVNDAFFVFMALANAERIAFVDEILVDHRKREGSIEVTREKAPHNTKYAYDAMRARLESDGLWEAFGRSCQNWGLSHLRWNYRSLPPGARLDAFEDYMDLLEELSDKPDDYYMRGVDRHIRDMIALGRSDSSEYAIAEAAYTEWQSRKDAERQERRADKLKRLNRDLKKQNTSLEEENQRLKSELDRLQSEAAKPRRLFGGGLQKMK